MKNIKVYITCSNKDKDIVESIKQALKDTEFLVKQGSIEDYIDYSHIESVKEDITNCSLLLVIWTEISNQSDYLSFEINKASKLGKKIVLLKFHEFLPNSTILEEMGNTILINVDEMRQTDMDWLQERLVSLLEKSDLSNEIYSTIDEVSSFFYQGISLQNSGNFEQANLCFEKAAAGGHSQAMYRLASNFYNGNGGEVNEQKANEFYLEAAERGNIDALKGLGDCYTEGYGVSQDFHKALELFLQAAEKESSEAMDLIGQYYTYGYGVTESYEKANEWYLKSAERGNYNAMVHLGYNYFYGQGLEQDFTKALEWYQLAAAMDNVEAMYNIGNYYLYGYGSVPDVDLAKQWLVKAADYGYDEAMLCLGTLYYTGENSQISQDLEEANLWFLSFPLIEISGRWASPSR